MAGWIVGGITATIALLLAMMFGLPVYSVWQQEYSGRATLAKAEQTRQVIVTPRALTPLTRMPRCLSMRIVEWAPARRCEVSAISLRKPSALSGPGKSPKGE